METENIRGISSTKLKEIYDENIDRSIASRYEYELKIIYENGFENIYKLFYLICKKAKEDNEIVILRGAGSSSLLSYLLGIGDVNPLEYNLQFEIFAGGNGEKAPDFVLNFSSKYQEQIHQYVKEIIERNNEVLVEKHNIKELACLRDDIFSYLMEQGIERKLAFEISEFVRKGKAHITENTRNPEDKKKEWKEYCNVMTQYNVPTWYIESLEKILYMFPKAHACNYVIMNLMLAWYKVYYPSEFNKVIEKWEKDYGE